MLDSTFWVYFIFYPGMQRYVKNDQRTWIRNTPTMLSNELKDVRWVRYIALSND